MVSSGSMSGDDKITMQEEYENALEGDMELERKIIKLGELNEQNNEHSIFSIITNSSVGMVVFVLLASHRKPTVDNC